MPDLGVLRDGMSEATYLTWVFSPAYVFTCLYLASLAAFGWLTRSERQALSPPLRLFVARDTIRLLRFVAGYSASRSGNRLASAVAWAVRVLFMISGAYILATFYFALATRLTGPSVFP